MFVFILIVSYKLLETFLLMAINHFCLVLVLKCHVVNVAFSFYCVRHSVLVNLKKAFVFYNRLFWTKLEVLHFKRRKFVINDEKK